MKKELENLLLTSLKMLTADEELEYLDILPQVRSLYRLHGDSFIEDPEIRKISNLLTEWDYQSPNLNLHLIYYNEMNGQPFVNSHEPDVMILTILWDSFVDITEIANLVIALMGSDCTGCCDATQNLTISKKGIFFKAEIGKTFHG